jgi:GNAT superfamily N-acetyltransferase
VTILAVTRERADSALAAALLDRYSAELAARFPGGFDPGDADTAAVSELTPPRGALFVARLDGRAVGCGGIRTLDEAAAEVKRMWVDPGARRRGVGRALLGALEGEGHALGAGRIRLDTSRHLDEAVALYRSSGYIEIAAYNTNPYAAHWFEKVLQA